MPAWSVFSFSQLSATQIVEFGLQSTAAKTKDRMPGKVLHPTFRKKPVVKLDCRFCGSCVCTRGMKAILLADTAVELYSTDFPPQNSVELIGSAYSTEKCRCKIKDFACLGCGNVVGYMVVQPCRACLQSCNNGHLWMYHSTAIDASDRSYIENAGCCILQWGHLVEKREEDICDSDKFLEECCR